MPILAIALVHFLAVISPGANFLVVARNSLAYSHRSGMLTARGVALGSLTYISIGMLGFATVISQSPLVFNAIRLVGVVYFIYTGVRALASLRKRPPLAERLSEQSALGQRQAFLGGLATALSNPTSALYFLALFTSFVPVNASLGEKVLTALVLISISFGWYHVIALTFSREPVRRFYRRFERWLNGLIGFLWLFLAARLVLSG